MEKQNKNMDETLSDKECLYSTFDMSMNETGKDLAIPTSDIKEFIRKLKEVLNKSFQAPDDKYIQIIIDKLAGSKLIEEDDGK